MSLRSRIALLVGVTVLLASAIGGVGTTISSRSVGRDRVDSALLNDADTFRIESPRLAAQLQFAFDSRRATWTVPFVDRVREQYAASST